jgi:hypothetical protein
MKDHGARRPPHLAASPPQECVHVDGYDVCFYPGFVRRLTLVAADGRKTTAYEQKSAFVLPPGQDKPWPSSTLEVRGNGTHVMVHVHDAGQQIDHIEIALKGRDGGRGPRLVVEDGPVLCPPLCGE